MKIGFITVSSRLGFDHAKEFDREICSRLGNALDSCFGAIYDLNRDILEKISETDLLLIYVATGGTEELIYELVRNSNRSVILTTMFYNSFPAALEAKSLLNEEGYRANIVNLDKFSLDILKKVLLVLDELYGKKVVLFGGPSQWLIYSKPNEDALYEKFGMGIEFVPLEKIVENISNVEPSEDILEFKKDLGENFAVEQLEKIGRVHQAIKSFLGYNVLAFSIRCFDIIKVLDVTACLPVSKFNDLGIIAGCEGDIPATVSMILGHKFSGKPTFMGNTVYIGENDVLLAHCTIATKLVSDYRLVTHFESGRGISIAGNLKVGEKVTVFKLSRDLDKIYVGVGEIIEGEPKYSDMCRTQIRVKFGKKIRNILDRPIGNHLVLSLGDISNELELLSKILNIEFSEL